MKINWILAFCFYALSLMWAAVYVGDLFTHTDGDHAVVMMILTLIAGTLFADKAERSK